MSGNDKIHETQEQGFTFAELQSRLAAMGKELTETKGELTKTKGELTKTKGELTETKKESAEKDKKLIKSEKRRIKSEKGWTKTKEVLNKMNIWGLLSGCQKIFDIVCRGNPSSNIPTKRTPVSSIECKHCEVADVLAAAAEFDNDNKDEDNEDDDNDDEDNDDEHDDNDDEDEDDDNDNDNEFISALKSKSSTLLSMFTSETNETNETNETVTYSTEADISILVHAALRDAVFIVNKMVKQHANPQIEMVKLEVRQEASLFSNRPDHSVVYDTLSGGPIFAVEDKKPMPEIEDNKSVLGQVFDYLQFMRLLGHPNPFVVLSTFEKSWVTWDNNVYGCSELAKLKNRLHKDNLKNIVNNWPRKTAIGYSQSPAKEEALLSEVEGNDEEEEKEEVEVKRPARKRAKTERAGEHSAIVDRKIARSKQVFMPLQLVPLFCNAIVASLTNYTRPSMVPLVENKEYKNRYLLILKSGTLLNYAFGKKSFTVKGPLIAKNKSVASVASIASRIIQRRSKGDFYILGLLGTGRTSKAFRAVTSNGYECVIKMYVRQFDENDNYAKIDTATFKWEAKEAVKAEKDFYKKIYKIDVITKELNGFQCLILPYFSPIKQRDDETIQKIREVLEGFQYKKSKHAPTQYFLFRESDMRWSHCGTIGSDYFVYDLAELQTTPNEDDFQKSTNLFIETLIGRKKKEKSEE